MELILPEVIDNYKKNGQVSLDKSTQFYTNNQNIPEYLYNVDQGFTEIVLDKNAYYAYRHDEGQAKYYLVRDQTEFEEWEDLLEIIAVCGFVISVGASFILGLMMASKIIAPVRCLTQQVRDHEKLIKGTPTLASNYPDDEIGSLAKAFDTTIGMLNNALEREAFFTSDVSHELRTPLMAIKSSCDILVAKNSLDTFTAQRIGMIAKAVDEMQSLVETFLALARRQDLPMKENSLHKIVEDEMQTWGKLASEQQLHFVLHDEVSSDNRGRQYPEVLLRTILNNLIRNAVQHARQGYITLLLTERGFEVHDTGTGVSEKDRERIFYPYYRGELSPQDNLGLGLSLVKRICERMHWQISLEDNQPHGCKFLVDLQ